MNPKQYGLIIPQITQDHWVLGGGNVPGTIINPSGDWTPYLPHKEPQSKNGVETQACTNFGTDNACETLEKFFSKPFNHSDRYFAIVSGTDPNKGNDPHAVAECLRKTSGALDESLLQFSDDITTPAQYYTPKPMTADLSAKAKNWYDTWDFAHEWVFTGGTPQEKREKLKDAMTKGTVCVSVAAWYFDDARNLFYLPAGAPMNHWVQLAKIEDDKYIVFDSYDAYLKDLDPLFDFAIAKVYYLNPPDPNISTWAKILDIIGQILKLDFLLIKQAPPQVPPVPQQPVPQPQPSVVQDVTPPHVSKIQPWAKAIQIQEGGIPTDRNMTHNNPGNLRYTAYTKSLGAIGHDADNFCRFDTYDHGFQALCQFLTDAANNQLLPYKNSTLAQFTQIYAQPPANHPYAANVAAALKVDVNTQIKNLL